jgi:biofilm PGA synthesis N-glycosyltransferase PgaC
VWSFIVVAVLIVGVNTIVWTIAGLVRLVAERTRGTRAALGTPPTARDVAVIIAAHNEELVIAETIKSIGAQISAKNVFVVSDGSSDKTAEVARAHGARVLELFPNRGKAGAIVATLKHFSLAERFEIVLLLDADTQLASDYIETGLPQFADQSVVAVAGRASTLRETGRQTLMGSILVAHRQRVYIAVQYLLKFGQAGRFANVVAIVPGFASMYRSRIMDSIDIAAKGLTIEDYNMTFEVHAKRLGRIAFHPKASVAMTQDPNNLHDYVRQVVRWNLGFWQTVARHRFQFRVFWFALSLFIVELLLSSLVLILLIPVVVISFVASGVDAAGLDPSGSAGELAATIPPLALALGILVPDFLLTLFAAIVDRRPQFIALVLVFPLLRILDAVLCLRALSHSFIKSSSGRWQSPARRPISGRARVVMGPRSAARAQLTDQPG